MNTALAFVRRFAHHPAVQILAGLAMVGSAVAEVLGPWVGEMGVGAEHGVLVYGITQLAKGIASAAEGVEKVEEALERKA